ncbi:hypothetical protein AVEN_250863-1 [Araneus ventricosus]|uniref:Uncharacterized protein n=1 Tax=Araneus ventricosus TaxID=182803 RepID=A0A4Y2IQI5_ARAVE|nr:hypothetical protein AVEN_250863-1 [Araneus ventricosus]
MYTFLSLLRRTVGGKSEFHLKGVIGSSNLSQELTTVLEEMEAVLNSQSLVPTSDNPDNYTVNTLSCLLIGSELKKKEFHLANERIAIR